MVAVGITRPAVGIHRPAVQIDTPSVKSALYESHEGEKAAFRRYGEDDDDDDTATVAVATINSRCLLDLLLEPVSDKTILINSIEKPIPSLAKKVHFGSLQIHEHGMELGGSGIPRMGGVPVTLGWERQAHYEVNVIEYDDLKSHHRTGAELLLTKHNRVNLLLVSGCTMREINTAAWAADTIRKSRVVNFHKPSGSRFGRIRRGWKKMIGGIRR